MVQCVLRSACISLTPCPVLVPNDGGFSALKMGFLQALVNLPINVAALIVHQATNEAIKFLSLCGEQHLPQ